MKSLISTIWPRMLERMARHLATCAALLALTLAHGQAMAQPKVLILSTAAHEINASALDVLANLALEFGPSVATTTTVDTIDVAGAVTAATFSPGYDLVIVARMNLPVEASNLNAINTAIAARQANGFVLFVV